jgi:P-type Ca2+ transporter type 2C
VDESALTGESVPVRKAPAKPDAVSSQLGRPGGDATPWVFSGTLVVKGHGLAVVRQTGTGTELGGIGKALRDIDTERTRLQREIDRLVRAIALLGVGAAAVVLVVYGLTRGNWLEGVLAGIATAMAMLPEEFPVVLTVFLALGAWRMSQRHVLTRRPPVVETLGSATVLCVDKTGTLTMNIMTVRELFTDSQSCVLTEEPLSEAFHELVEFSVLASPIDPFDPMDKAFKAIGEKYLAGTGHLHNGWALLREYPLSEKLLALSHVWSSPEGDRYVVAAKGAPEAIADLCRRSVHRRLRRWRSPRTGVSASSVWHAHRSARQPACPLSSTTSLPRPSRPARPRPAGRGRGRRRMLTCRCPHRHDHRRLPGDRAGDRSGSRTEP